MRYLCQVSLSLKVPKFHSATALQHCLNHLVALRLAARRPWRGIAPPMTVSLFRGFRSFHCSFTIEIELCDGILTFCSRKRLDLLAKFTNGFPIGKMTLMP